MTVVAHSHQILIRAPLQSVFDYVSDLTRHPEWSHGELHIEAVTTEPIAVGKEYISHGEVAGQKNRPNQVRITEYESPQRFGFSANDPVIENIAHVFTFTEREGGTLVKRTMTMSLNPVVAFLFRFFIYPWISSPAMDKSLALLKARLEEKS